ncbi:MAG: hypothetical protein ABW080_15055 [Candidatus Thiodiazotropha sp.]
MTNRMHIWLVGMFILLLASQSSQSVAQEERSITLLPDSLSQWYKPANKRQVWLHTMFALRRELQAVDEYAAERDRGMTQKWSDKFLDHFRKLPEMVPEWRDEIEFDEALRLESASRSGDFDTVTSAVSRLKRNCRNCHREYRALAALRYRSGDFSTIRIADEQGVLQDYVSHMEALSQSVNRIKIATEDNRWKRAIKASGQLRVQLHRLADSCESCHQDDPPRERILGSDSHRTLDELDQALSKQQPKVTGRKLGEAAVIICARCHGVHRTIGDARSFLFD